MIWAGMTIIIIEIHMIRYVSALGTFLSNNPRFDIRRQVRLLAPSWAYAPAYEFKHVYYGLWQFDWLKISRYVMPSRINIMNFVL